MPYIHIRDFRIGMDRTRDVLNSAAGSLWTLKNGHITRGGDIERAKKFVPVFQVPGTVGYAAVNGEHYVFASQPVAVPAGVRLQVLAHPTGATLQKILDVEPRDGRLYVVAQYADGTVHHFFDKKRVTDWDDPAIAGSYLSMADVVARLATLIDAESDYTASSAGNEITITGPSNVFFPYSGAVEDVSGNGDQNIAFAVVQEAGAPLPEALASAKFSVVSGVKGTNGAPAKSSVVFYAPTSGASTPYTVSQIVVGGDGLMNAPETGNVPPDTRVDIAAGVAAQVNAGPGGYFAEATSGRCKLTAPIAGSALNGVTPYVDIEASTVTLATVPFAGGVDPKNRVTSINVNSVDILGAPVPFGDSPAATASAIVAQINANTSTPNYTAVAVNGDVTVTAVAGSGATPNGFSIIPVTEGAFVINAPDAFAGGVDAGTLTGRTIRATLTGTFDARDRYTITLDDRDFTMAIEETGIGLTAFLYKSKIHTTGLSILRYSSIDNPRDFKDQSRGAGFLNISNNRRGDSNLAAIAEFQEFAAIFSGEDIKIYALNEDDDLNNYVGSVENTGTFAPNSVVSFGNSDVFYLDYPGIRSLRARSLTNAAFTEDVGTPIDPFVREWIATLSADAARDALGFIEPEDGRYWLSVGNRIFVFTYFPSKKISAWSYYEPGFTPVAFGKVRERVFARGANTIYAYGGLDGLQYPAFDETPIEIRLPFMDADAPATEKKFSRLHFGATNRWVFDAAYDPRNPEFFDHVGTADGSTFSTGDIPFEHMGVGAALRFTCSEAGAATLSRLTVHYDEIT